MNTKNIAIKRISSDMKEIYKNPIEGIGIASLDNDITKYVVNIMLLTGPYKNYCLQLLLTFPDNYPIKPPKILIYPGQLFDNLYHHHVFNDETKKEDGKCYRKLCIDLLDNDFMSTKDENTGWNPSYTISTLLLQVQIFLSNPDLSENSMPKPYQIKELMDSMSNYERIFTLNDENGETIKIHTWKDPYPKMYFKDSNEQIQNEDLKHSDKNILIKENLTCFITKLNIFDDPNIILGYPLVKEKSKEIYPIPEIVSYEGYLSQLSNEQSDTFSKSLKSANNKYYDKWLPIFISQQNFETNKQTILNSFSVIKYGLSGEKNCDFKPEYIQEVMFRLLNRMILDIKEKKYSSSYLRAFFQYILLYKKLSEIYPIEVNKYFDYDFILRNEISSNIGDFMIFTFFEKIQLLENLLFKLKEMMKNNLAFQFFLEKKECELISSYNFLEHLEENNLFNSIFEIMKFERNLFLYNGKKLKNFTKKIICNSFKKFLINSDKDTKDNLKKIILKNVKFYNFVDLNKFLNDKLDNGDEKNIKNIFDNFTILLYFRKIIKEKDIINHLEENFGVYFDIDEIISKLNEIIENIDIYYEKEIDNIDKSIYQNINNIIRELFILDINSNKHLLSLDFSGFDDIFKHHIFRHDHLDFFYWYGRCFWNRIKEYKKETHSFDKIEKINIDNLRLIYLYCLERLKKSINPNNKRLTSIESKFIECGLNNNKNDEWYNYISDRQNYEYINGNQCNEESKILSQAQIIKLFRYSKILNEQLLSKMENGQQMEIENFKDLKCKFNNTKQEFFQKVIIKNINKIACLITGKKYESEEKNERNNIYRNFFIFESKPDYEVTIDEPFLEKLKLIYELNDISLLTFYEFVWFEEHYDICDGFLSALKFHVLYNFRMRNHINKITQNIKNKKQKIVYKKEKKITKNKSFKFNNNNKINIWQKQIKSLKKCIPFKTIRKLKFK